MKEITYYKYRKFKSRAITIFTVICVVIVTVPLMLILYDSLSKGINYINWDFFTKMPKPVGEAGGGMANAIVGTGIMVAIGSIFSIPVSILAGIYLSENKNHWFAFIVKFFTDVLNGIPSIVVGVVAYIIIVMPMKRFSALAGGVALGIIMIPLITRTTEEMMKLVPESFREAALGLGISRWKTVMFIIFPAALRGIFTGILLAIARAAGETAPLLFTALGNRFWSTQLDQPIASLSVFIFDYAKAPFDDWNQQAWAASFVLIMLVLLLNIIFRIVTRKRYAA